MKIPSEMIRFSTASGAQSAPPHPLRADAAKPSSRAEGVFE